MISLIGNKAFHVWSSLLQSLKSEESGNQKEQHVQTINLAVSLTETEKMLC